MTTAPPHPRGPLHQKAKGNALSLGKKRGGSSRGAPALTPPPPHCSLLM